MKAKNIALAPLLLGLGLISSTAQADDMTLYNDQRSSIVDLRIMKSDNTWGGNELSQPLASGNDTVIHFHFAHDTECSRNVVVKTASGQTFNQIHDFCRYHGLHLHSDGLHHTDN